MIKKLLRRPSFAPIRYWLWKGDARRDAKTAKNFARSQGKNLVDIYRSPVLDSSVSGTVFILGSGWSVNDLSAEMLQHIESNQSIGINFWFFHDFVPSAFSFDAGKVSSEDEKQVRDSLVSFGVLFGRKSVRDSKPKILYLRPYRSDPGYLVPTPPELEGLVWVCGRANLVSKNTRCIEADLRLLIQRMMRGKLPRTALPDNGSSAVRLVFLALAQGFTEIVLVGVDLDARPHFWFSSEYIKRYPEFVALFPKPDDKPHGTTESNNRALGNREFFVTLEKILTELGVAKLSVGSPSSQLAGDLPLYRWPAENGQP